MGQWMLTTSPPLIFWLTGWFVRLSSYRLVLRDTLVTFMSILYAGRILFNLLLLTLYNRTRISVLHSYAPQTLHQKHAQIHLT